LRIIFRKKSSGGGIWIKVLEGFARKCLVVAAKLRTFGYDIKDGEEAYIADEPAIFAMRCLELMKSPQVAERIADRAYRRFLKCWTWDSYEGSVQTVAEFAIR
jgi:glycosyltransferase involved in cell wall biosynthesis